MHDEETYSNNTASFEEIKWLEIYVSLEAFDQILELCAGMFYKKLCLKIGFVLYPLTMLDGENHSFPLDSPWLFPRCFCHSFNPKKALLLRNAEPKDPVSCAAGRRQTLRWCFLWQPQHQWSHTNREQIEKTGLSFVAAGVLNLTNSSNRAICLSIGGCHGGSMLKDWKRPNQVICCFRPPMKCSFLSVQVDIRYPILKPLNMSLMRAVVGSIQSIPSEFDSCGCFFH